MRWRAGIALIAALIVVWPEVAAAKAKAKTAAKQAPPGAVKRSPPSGFTITVRDHAGASGGTWPFTAGVPLPRGWIRDPHEIELRDERRALPGQTRALSRWSDGSIRWVLLDWQSELQPHATRTFEVKRGTMLTPPSPIKIAEQSDRIDINTGALELSIPKAKAGLLYDVRRNGRPALDGAVTEFFVVNGKRQVPQAPKSVRVLENGPLRARVEMRGRIGAEFDYVVRIDAYANQPYVRILHSFENHAAARYTALQQVGLEIPMQLKGRGAFRAGREAAGPIEGAVGNGAVDLYQEDAAVFYQGAGRSEGRLSGWFDLHDAARGVALVSRYFWQEYPQSVELRSDGLLYNLWAPQSAVAAKVGMGAAKTHELVLYFHGEALPIPALLDGLHAPVLGHADAAWITESGAMRNSITPGPGSKGFLSELGAAFDRYRQHADREEWDDSGDVHCQPETAQRRRQGFYGMFNWGDWNYPGYHDDTKGCDAWGNLEYDMTQVLALAYAATGESRYVDAMAASARHFTDVDRIHYARERPNWVGMNHPKNPLHFAFELGGVDLGHTWVEGLLSYYAFSGDDRALDAARGIAEYLVARLRGPVLKGNPRQWGWPQIALVAVYEMTGDARYRNAAREYATRGMKAHPPEPGKDWKLGILAEALGYTHSITGERAIAEWLTRYAAAVTAYPGEPDPRFLPALAYVGRAAAKPQFQQVATKGIVGLKFGNWGKPWTIAGRLGFAVLGAATATEP